MRDALQTHGRRLARQLTSWPVARAGLARLGQASLLPPSIWKRLPIEGVFTITMPDGVTFHYYSVETDAIGRALHWRGIAGWETESIKVFYALAKTSNSVLDIGANTGFYSLLTCAANPHATVRAFEPVPHIFKLLQHNISLNHWQARCIADARAVADRTGRASFHLPFGTVPTSASLNPNGFRGYKGDLIEVELCTLDEVIAAEQHVVDIDLAKIDVEGFEDGVLRGMRRILAESRPALMVECLITGPYRQVEEILKDYGYSFFHILPTGPQPGEHIQPDPNQKYQNFLCLPEHRLASLTDIHKLFQASR